MDDKAAFPAAGGATPTTGRREFVPRLIAWEVTRRCPLNCRHCRAQAANRQYDGELSTAECLKVLDNIASFANPVIILTGGEPMARDDIYRIARYGTRLGLRMVMAPCGQLIDTESIQAMKAAGIKRISLSLDGADPATHDSFRRVKGAFETVIRAAGLAREGGLEFQINTTVTRLNYRQLDRILDLAVDLGAVGYHPFLLVPTGRGRDLAQLAIDPREYEEVLVWIYRRSLDCPIQLKPTCAPHYYRVFRQQEKKAGRRVTAKRHGLNAMTRGCLGGTAFAFISHTGKVQICGFLDLEAGDIRRTGYDFQEIWDQAPLFSSLREPANYHGRCGICEYHRVCGGCRARAYATSGDYLAEEPFCIHQPARM